jgi:putative intracellular protease/amidase
MTSSSGPQTHAVLLFDGVDELDAVGPFEVLSAAGLPVRAVGLPGADPVVRGANGMTFVVDGVLHAPPPGARAASAPAGSPGRASADEASPDGASPADVSPADASPDAASAPVVPGVLLVPGGGWFDAGPGVRALVQGGALPRLVAALHAGGTTVASVCTGAMLLGAAGLLAGRPAVTNAGALDDLAAFGADVRADARVVDDGDLLTAGGPLAGVDLALRLVERALGAPAARDAAARIEHDRRGPLVLRAGAAA